MKKILLCLLIITVHITGMSPYDCALEHQKNERFEQAISGYETILINDPLNLNVLFHLGHCYLALGRGPEAINAFETITQLNPGILPARYNNAYTHKTIGMLDEAIELYKQIIKQDSEYDPAQLALGFAYLTKGDFENGWRQHERYLKKSGKNGDRLRTLLANNTVAGKKILLRPEGGLGDSLQFVRYAQQLHTMGAYVIVAAQKPLLSLFSRCQYIDQLISCHDQLPACHADATLMSLPAIFNDTESTFPTNIPYISADQKLVNQWHNTLAHDTRYKIGLCWQADKKNDESRLPIARRGCPLTNFIPLQNIEGISLYSLQKYDGVEELANMPIDFPLIHFDNLDEHTKPFEDTAALMKNLDLIITVDTAVAHLAGALGCNVWLLLPYSTDWRWIHGKIDSPWYPTMKIFKQSTPFDWQEVIENISDELKKTI